MYQKVESGVSKLVNDKVKEQAEQGKPFDISGMAPNGAALMVAAIVLMSALRTADNTLSSKLSLVGFDATKATAASMVREGVANLSSSIAQGVGQMAITGVGAKKNLSGRRRARRAEEQRAQAGQAGRRGPQHPVRAGPSEHRQAGHRRRQPEAGGSEAAAAGRGKPGAGELNAQSNAAGSVADGMAGDTIGLQSSKQRLSKEHETALGGAGENLSVKGQAEQLAMDDTKLKAEAKKTTGRAIMDSSSAASNIAGGSGRYAATLEQSEQQISQASSRVANTASEETRESSRKSDSFIQELLHLDTISQSRARPWARWPATSAPDPLARNRAGPSQAPSAGPAIPVGPAFLTIHPASAWAPASALAMQGIPMNGIQTTLSTPLTRPQLAETPAAAPRADVAGQAVETRAAAPQGPELSALNSAQGKADALRQANETIRRVVEGQTTYESKLADQRWQAAIGGGEQPPAERVAFQRGALTRALDQARDTQTLTTQQLSGGLNSVAQSGYEMSAEQKSKLQADIADTLADAPPTAREFAEPMLFSAPAPGAGGHDFRPRTVGNDQRVHWQHQGRLPGRV